MKYNYLNIYNNLIKLTRNKILYINLEKDDIFSDRLIFFFLHFALFLKHFKGSIKANNLQELFDFVIRQIELSIREIGYGDVSVNKKMKELNKILYDILLKIKPNFKKGSVISFNQLIFVKYFEELDGVDNLKYNEIKSYFSNFYNYCSKLSLDNILKEVINFKNNGSS